MLQWLLVTGYSALFLWIIRRTAFFRLESIPARWMEGAFILKVVAGCFVGWLYYGYYRDRTTADTIKFFNDGNLLFDTIWTEPRHFFMMLTGIGGKSPELLTYYERMSAWLNADVLFNDNKTIIRANAIFRFFSLGNYYVHVVFINFISFTGLIALLKLFCRYLPGKESWIFAALFLYPSLLIWGSGLLKDGLLLFALGALLLSFDTLLRGDRKTRNTFVFLASLFMLLFTKFYVIAAVAPGIVAWLAARRTSGWKTILIFTSVYAGCVAIAFNLHHIRESWNIIDLIYWKQHNFLAQADIMRPGSRIDIPVLEYGIRSILQNTPSALVRTIFRPALSDDLGNPMVLMAALENTLLLSMTGYLLLFHRAKKLPALSPIFAFSIFAGCFILSLIGLITPILGALVRYKVVTYPFLAFIVLSLTEKRSEKHTLQNS